jgi:hypothetical protein
MRGQCGQDVVAYNLDITPPLDIDVDRRARVAAVAPVDVVLHQWLGLRVIDTEARLDSFLLVIGTLHQRFAGEVVFARNLGRIELHVVAAS